MNHPFLGHTNKDGFPWIISAKSDFFCLVDIKVCCHGSLCPLDTRIFARITSNQSFGLLNFLSMSRSPKVSTKCQIHQTCHSHKVVPNRLKWYSTVPCKNARKRAAVKVWMVGEVVLKLAAHKQTINTILMWQYATYWSCSYIYCCHG